ncbi:unnamed protein product [Clonostachys chloroleuca]|uniref:Zn(2)-C6 fungal-type domain-containing protein n=1 Tax=Clonostachys chloroleuca TaxID=1926264 RepID=A0AA35VAK5_9HYPO|nr:unnamed protein product [Clonostachys chloroleuca]
MVGVAKSTACKSCKGRRIKCDQRWPTCGQCRRKSLKCPGPSSLLKFVHEGGGSSQARSASQPGLSPGPEPSSSRIQLLDSRVTDDRGRYLSMVDGNAGYRKMKLVSVPPDMTSLEHQAGARLVNSLEGDPSLLTLFNFLQHMPSRFAHSPCLRDVAILFCSTHSALRRGGSPSTDVSIMRDYGRALRTLRQTLEVAKDLELETLASVALLSRAESVFNPFWTPFNRAHAEAVASFVVKLGHPKPDDVFHMDVLFQSVEDLLFHSLSKSQTHVFNQPLWRQTITDATLLFFPPELRPYGHHIISIFYEYLTKTPRLLAKVYKIHQNPFNPGMQELASYLSAALNRDSVRAKTALGLVFQKALEVGQFKKVFDANFFLGEYYQVKNARLGESITLFQSLIVGIARIRYDLAALYGYSTASTLHDEYRDACEDLWMFIPLRIELYHAFAFGALTILAPSYEASETHERDYLNDLLQDQYRYSTRLPKDKPSLEVAMMMRAKAMTGRLPPAFQHG